MENYYKQLKSREYKTFTTCQLPGCNKPIKRLFIQKIRKYCCPEHAQKAKMMYLAEWKLRNKDRRKEYNHRYWIKIAKRKKDGEYPLENNQFEKKYENKETAAD